VEISYFQAEVYLAGELKQCPIALLDAKMPAVSTAVLAPRCSTCCSDAGGG
jgi:glucosamine 6-phosphate synthetase-like amidotransferase/phosphosugar isomerase protein